VIVNHGIIAGAATAPIFVPELKIPIANARSFWGEPSSNSFNGCKEITHL
jgi:hypothetical protein